MLCAKPGQKEIGVGAGEVSCGMLDFRVVGASGPACLLLLQELGNGRA